MEDRFYLENLPAGEAAPRAEDRFYLESYLAEETAPYELIDFDDLCSRVESEFRR